uniref:Uncharacterized protein n=1 Tax=Tetranychus urticae TaxID=32264 RepID=T1KF48_TETUR
MMSTGNLILNSNLASIMKMHLNIISKSSRNRKNENMKKQENNLSIHLNNIKLKHL